MANASVAALVHGTVSHSYELDDTLNHPGAPVIPAVLAVAARAGASQAMLFRAVAAGYEAMARANVPCEIQENGSTK
ncbi:MmgE/PrpD family protein [Burkholderia anthina]|uniref:MmgE/PrpD family protein n=1 Tax=Burkholderia anthina TaxID=179879 RepID=UPI001FC828CE|nr:MmgE/PrpD family protein [Burkholderia anthina]